MKRSYKKMEVYKVKFNASEQITAACAIIETAARFEGGGLEFCHGSTQWTPAVPGMPECAYPQNTIDLQLRYTYTS